MEPTQNEAAEIMHKYVNRAKQLHCQQDPINRNKSQSTRQFWRFPDIHPFHRMVKMCKAIPALSPTHPNFDSLPKKDHADVAWEMFYQQWYHDRQDHSLPPHYTETTPGRKTLPPYLLHDNPSTASKRARLRFGRALIAYCWYHSGNKTSNPECSNCRGNDSNSLTPYQLETVDHIIEQCPRYKLQREKCIHELNTLSTSIPFNTQTVLAAHNQPQLKPYLTRILDITGTFIQKVQSIRKF